MIKSSIRIKVISIGIVLAAIILAITFWSNTRQDKLDPLERYSKNTIEEWEKLLDNGIGSKLDISAVDKDIKVTAEGVIGYDLNTLVLLKIEDLKGESKYSIDSKDINLDSLENYPIKISGDISAKYTHKEPSSNNSFYTIPSYSTLYSPENKTNRIILSTTEIDGDEGSIDINISRLSTLFNNDEVSPVNIEGEWNLQIPVKKSASKYYEMDETIEFDGNEVVIQKITIAPTNTIVEGKIKRANEEKDYILEKVTLSIRHGLKKYGLSNFPFVFSARVINDEYTDMTQMLQSLYSEFPDKIEAIVESYEYFVGDKKTYDIDTLPQTIEYNGSNITIEDIVHNGEFFEIIVREDPSKDRNYTFTSFDTIIYRDNYEVFSGSRFADYELRDKKGRVTEDYKNHAIGFFLKEQRIMPSENIQLYPKKISIKGQNYIEYPNAKISIPLR